MLITIVTLLFSCSPKYAVSLTSTKNMHPGDIFKIKGQTFQKIGLKSVSFYVLADEQGEFNEITSCVETFTTKKKATHFVNEYRPYLNMYAQATGKHNIRPERNPQASGAYRMREGEIVKVISKDKEQTIIDGKSGYWVEVLTDDGYRGYSFDYKLNLFEMGKDGINENISGNTLSQLQELFSKPFYPFYYNDFIKENRIDLTEINIENGLYIDEAQENLIFKTADISISFLIQNILAQGKNRFSSIDNNLSITIIDPNYLIIAFTHNEKNISFDMCTIENLEDIATQEQEKRNQFYQKILSLGPTFTSSAYGTITFFSDRTFIWNNFDPLVPSHIGQNATNRGWVSFELHMTKECAAKYDDALTLSFNGAKGGIPASFFIQLDEANKAFRFYTVPKAIINSERLATRDNPSPQIIYFKAQ